MLAVPDPFRACECGQATPDYFVEWFEAGSHVGYGCGSPSCDVTHIDDGILVR